jgi:hypothetical protein
MSRKRKDHGDHDSDETPNMFDTDATTVQEASSGVDASAPLPKLKPNVKNKRQRVPEIEDSDEEDSDGDPMDNTNTQMAPGRASAYVSARVRGGGTIGRGGKKKSVALHQIPSKQRSREQKLLVKQLSASQ